MVIFDDVNINDNELALRPDLLEVDACAQACFLRQRCVAFTLAKTGAYAGLDLFIAPYFST